MDIRDWKSLILAGGLWAAVTCFAGCGGGETDPSGAGGSTAAEGADGGLSELTGKILIDGSSTVYPISEAVAAGFREPFPNVDVPVAISGTGGGFKRFTKAETDISDASRPIKAKEFEACREAGVDFLEIPVAYDGLTIVVNPENDWADQLTVDELKAIFLEEQAAKTWKEVNDAWPDTEIKIYAPGTDSGTFDYFKEVVAGDEGSMRKDMSVSEEDNQLVTGVAGEKGAIGFFGAAYFFNNQEKLKALKIVNPENGTAVAPEPATIESGEYAPFSRPLFIYVNIDSLKRPEVKKFVEYYLDNAAEKATQVGYVGLPSELYERARKHYEDRIGGTHFLDADGNKQEGSLTELYEAEKVTPVIK